MGNSKDESKLSAQFAKALKGVSVKNTEICVLGESNDIDISCFKFQFYQFSISPVNVFLS